MGTMNILLLAMKSKYAQGAIGGLIAGFFLGAKLIGTDNSEAMRQLVKLLQIANGG